MVLLTLHLYPDLLIIPHACFFLLNSKNILLSRRHHLMIHALEVHVNH